jgi:hypothetical protein
MIGAQLWFILKTFGTEGDRHAKNFVTKLQLIKLIVGVAL